MDFKLLNPSLRFNGFNADWVTYKFSELYEFKTTNSYSRDLLNYSTGNVKNIHYGDIHTKYNSVFNIEIETVPFINVDVDLKKIKDEQYLSEGDLVIADASEDYKDIGKTIEVVNLAKQKVLAGLHTFLARKKSNMLFKGFAAQLMQSWTVRHQVMRIAQGTKVLGIATSRLGNVDLPLPSVEEQQKIADFLSSVDKKISLLKEKHALLTQYKKGAMQKLFKQEIRFKDENNNDFPEWKTERIDYFVERCSNPVKVENDATYREIGVRSHGKGIFHKEPITGTELGGKRVFWVHPDAFVVNIVFAWEHAVAKTSDAENGFIASHRFPMYLPKCNRVDLRFFTLFFKSKRGKYLLELASPGGAGRNKTLGQSNFAELKVAFPDIREQKRIADFHDALDRKLEKIQQQIELTQTFKKGLLQQMFV